MAFKQGDIVKHKYVREAQEGRVKRVLKDGYLTIEWYKWVDEQGISTVYATDPPDVIVLLDEPEPKLEPNSEPEIKVETIEI